MADKKIEDLPEVGTLSGATTWLEVLDEDGNSRKLALEDLKTFINTDPTVVPSSVPWRGARVNRSSDLTGLTSPYTVAFNNEIVDTDGFWSIGAPTRLTIPAGISKVRFFWSINFEASLTAGSVATTLAKNGGTPSSDTSYGFSVGRQGTTGFNNNQSMGFSGALDVVEADYFEINALFSMSGQDQILASNRTWFEIEVLEAMA